jgi:hypothetical protein
MQSSAGVVIAPAGEVRVPPVGPVGQPVAESDDFEEVFSVETDGVELCEAVLRLVQNISATPAIRRLARDERWPPYDNKAEETSFRVFVNCLLDAARRAY